jgi:hypothetical protein
VSPRVEEILTHVGHVGWKEHCFRGRRVFEELVPTEGVWSLLSLACGGPLLDARASRLFDTITACCLASDPRIWPLKLARLVSAYGGAGAAVCATLQIIDSGRLAGPMLLASASFLRELAIELGEAGLPDPAAVEAAVRARIAGKVRFPGFGVPHRPEDERVVALRRQLEREGYSEGRHFRLAREVSGHHDRRLRSGGLNIVGATASLCLDLGLEPHHLLGFSLVLPFASYVANAAEGAAQRPEVLRRLPLEVIEYRGPAPRCSPRARTADLTDGEGARTSPARR